MFGVSNLTWDKIKEQQLPVGKSTFKVRVVNTTARVDKLNGFRIIYYTIKDDGEI